MKKYFSSQDARGLIKTFGFAIFPVHGITENNECTCGQNTCTNKGKHPATPDGFKSATNNIDDMLRLWGGRQQLNVGIATGQKSGVFVIDIDSAEGEKNLKALGTLPVTLSVSTGKGRHLYFRYPDEPVITKKSICPGVDVRGDGGYVCGPGSNHISGQRYEFINILEEIQKAPDFILDMVVKSRIKQDPQALQNEPPRMSVLKTALNDGWSLQDTLSHLSYISPDIGYDEWIAVGMALQSEGYGLEIWDNWSSKGVKYKGIKDTAAHWKSFRPNSGITYGTVVHMAKNAGWVPSNHSPATMVASPSQPPCSPLKNGEQTPFKNAPDRKLPLIYADQAQAITDTADFIENILCENQFSVVYGESNCGKTFFMLDLALHVALGMPWRGHDVDQGGVIYAALEGGYATQNRIVAFKAHHGITQHIPLAVIPSSINMLDPAGDINALIEAIWQAKEKIGNIKLIIIDTLARAMQGGDENGSQDMGQLIINADSIRAITGAHISFVHHCGKDAAKGARGHSSLRAAVDTEIEISRDDNLSPSRIKIAKQREMPMIEDKWFSLKSIELGMNARNKPVTSCVVVPSEGSILKDTKKMTPLCELIYESLVEALLKYAQSRVMYKDNTAVPSVTYDELREIMEAKGFKEILATENKTTAQQIKSATQTARNSLRSQGKINFNKNYLWLISDEKRG